jgi:hypothetical protein
VRVASRTAVPVYIAFGSSLLSIGASNAMLVSGADTNPQVFSVPDSKAYVAFKSSTDVILNFTLGYGQ